MSIAPPVDIPAHDVCMFRTADRMHSQRLRASNFWRVGIDMLAPAGHYWDTAGASPGLSHAGTIRMSSGVVQNNMPSHGMSSPTFSTCPVLVICVAGHRLVLPFGQLSLQGYESTFYPGKKVNGIPVLSEEAKETGLFQVMPALHSEVRVSRAHLTGLEHDHDGISRLGQERCNHICRDGVCDGMSPRSI